MKNLGKLALFLIVFLGNANTIFAQLNVTNLMEYQYGKLPGDSNSFSSVYDRAVLAYNYEKFKASATLEQFYTPYNERNYLKLSQYALQFKSKPIEVNVGNFYETIGRGLMLRSFEIPGAVIEDLGYRSRHYFNRDILGFNAKFKQKNFTSKVLYGRPLNYVYPPTVDDTLKRTDIVEAIYADYSFNKQTAGASVLHLTNKSVNSVFGMFNMSGKILPFMSYYVESAKNVSDYEFSDFSNQAAYALYASLNFSFESLGISVEYKNYNNFLLGAGINEPPALVKEHTYKVLNRSTHVLQPANEEGYQLEAFYTFQDLSMLTLNNTLAVNDFGTRYIYQEYFAEYSFSLYDKHDLKFFADYAEDPFNLVESRISAGTYLEWKAFSKSAIRTEYEFQAFNRSDEQVQNHVLALGYAYGSKFIINIVAELSNDAFLVDNSKFKTWIGTNVNYQINNEHSIQLFAGQRRGGPACNAGVCYEVLDFYGVELRLKSRF